MATEKIKLILFSEILLILSQKEKKWKYFSLENQKEYINSDRKEYILKLGKEISLLWEWEEDICLFKISLSNIHFKKSKESREKMSFQDSKTNLHCKILQKKLITHMKLVQLDHLTERIKVCLSHRLQNLSLDRKLEQASKQQALLNKKVQRNLFKHLQE